MASWFIVRHGETDWNAQGRIQGHSDVALSVTGGKQAGLVAARLAQVPFDVAYSSDLQRSAETARRILGSREVPLHTSPELREYHKGVLEGMTAAETKDRYPRCTLLQ